MPILHPDPITSTTELTLENTELSDGIRITRFCFSDIIIKLR